MSAGSPARRLLARFAREVSEEDLREIAAADYGQGIEEHLQGLRRIRATNEVPAGMPWHPHEVLLLTRWSDPESFVPRPSAPLRGHVVRGFCCAALLLYVVEHGDDTSSEGDTVARLVASSIALGAEYEGLALAYLQWRLPELERKVWVEAPFYAFVALLLWLRLAVEPDPAEVCRRVRALIELENQVRESEWPGYPATPSPFLTGLTHDLSKNYWLGFAQMLSSLGQGLSGQARVEVCALASRIGE